MILENPLRVGFDGQFKFLSIDFFLMHPVEASLLFFELNLFR
jgi:hypothetical protein